MIQNLMFFNNGEYDTKTCNPYLTDSGPTSYPPDSIPNDVMMNYSKCSWFCGEYLALYSNLF
jgi:hypothetical protein